MAENKHDLLLAANTTTAPTTSAEEQEQQQRNRRRQQIVSLMQRFPFVRQCIKCSAKDFLHVDDIFLKAQQAVLYPFTSALYDLDQGQLSTLSQRALLHIFRLYDFDQDHLLSDAEMEHFQRQVVDLEEAGGADLTTWKKIVRGQQQQPTSSSRHDPLAPPPLTAAGTTTVDPTRTRAAPAVAAAAAAVPTLTTVATPTPELVIELTNDGNTAFTAAGFLAIFDVLISQNRLDCVWETLRKFGYSDDLKLLPPTTHDQQDPYNWSDWKLPNEERAFLVRLFHQFASLSSEAGDGSQVLTVHDMTRVFATVEPPLPPWSPPRATALFKDFPLRPQQHYYTPSSASPSPSSSQQSPVSPSSPVSSDSASPGHDDGHRGPATSAILSTSGISILSASDSIPSLGSLAAATAAASNTKNTTDTGNILVSLSQPTTAATTMNLLEWMGHWHLMAATSQAVTQLELYRLGFVAPSSSLSPLPLPQTPLPKPQRRRRRVPKPTPQQLQQRTDAKPTTTTVPPSMQLCNSENSRELRVLVLGGRTPDEQSHKTASELIGSLCCSGSSSSATDATVVVEGPVTTTTSPADGVASLGWIETSQARVHLTRNHPPSRKYSSLSTEEETLVVHFIFYHVPDALVPLVISDVAHADGTPPVFIPFDLVLLAFEDLPSFEDCQRLERQYVKRDLPRVFVAVSTKDSTPHSSKSTALRTATNHCAKSELEGQPLLWSTTIASPSSSMSPTTSPLSTTKACHQQQAAFLTVLARCCLRGNTGIDGLLQSSPHEAQKRRREQLLQTIGLVGVVGVVVVIGVGYFSLASAWVRSLFCRSSTSQDPRRPGHQNSPAATFSASAATRH